MILGLTLLAITATTGVRAEQAKSDLSAAFENSPSGTVVLSEAQADSLIRLLDEMELKIRLLEADLAEVRPEPEPTGNWIIRAVKHPALWFVVGIGLGSLLD